MADPLSLLIALKVSGQRVACCFLAALTAFVAQPAHAQQTGDLELSDEAAVNPVIDTCTCVWRGSFSKIAASNDLVVLGRVSRVRGNAVDLDIEQQLVGETWLPTIRVWMKTRNYCRPEASTFEDGSRWVMAVNQIDQVPEDGFNPSTPNQSYGRPDDYILSSCGGYYLKVNGNTVTGNLLPEAARWDYEPDMRPVLVDLVAGYLRGEVTLENLRAASEEDPAVRDLMLDTRSFLRGQEGWMDETASEPEEGADPDGDTL